MSRKIIYFKNFAAGIEYKYYNSQEIGLCKAFVENGFDCDIISFSDNKKDAFEEIYNNNSNKITLYKLKAFKFLSNAVYFNYLNKKKLKEYDLIITTEYNQIMTYFLSKLCPEKTVLYHGPYEDNSRKIVQKVFDMLFTPAIIKNVKFAFTKSVLAQNYLQKKGFKKTAVIGVGLNPEQFENVPQLNLEEIEHIPSDTKRFLFVGRLVENKNPLFLLDVIAILKKNIKLKAIIIGSGTKEYEAEFFRKVEQLGLTETIIHYPVIRQSEIGYFYKNSDILLLPSVNEIFGMVILESMYFGVPVISSINGGSSCVIKNYENGIVIDEFKPEIWADKILNLFRNEDTYKKISFSAKNTISKEFAWKHILCKINDCIGLFAKNNVI